VDRRYTKQKDPALRFQLIFLQVVTRASHLKPGSEYFDNTVSLPDPNARLHSAIWSSSGSFEAISKNLPLCPLCRAEPLITTKSSV